MAKQTYYQVHPRYGCGSPAMVDRETALRVAEQEQLAWLDAKEGLGGDLLFTTAKVLGLRAVAESMIEKRAPAGTAPAKHRDGWLVRDLLTHEEYWRPHAVKQYDLHLGAQVIRRVHLGLVPIYIERCAGTVGHAALRSGDSTVAEWHGALVRLDPMADDLEAWVLRHFTPRFRRVEPEWR